MWNIVWTVLKQPFVWGFAIGLLLTLVALYMGYLKRRQLKKDLAEREKALADLKQHLSTHLDVTAEGSAARQAELEKLRQQNENLRVAVKALQEKPDRRDRRTMEIYQRAVELMHENSPAFAPVWEACCRRSEEELAAAESGTVARAWHKLFPRRTSMPAIEAKDLHDVETPESSGVRENATDSEHT